MTSTPPSRPYALGKARHGNSRLNLQHYLAIQQFNNDLLDPHIVDAFPQGIKTPNLRIADMCCGTGMWLVDMSNMVDESAELHGFDLAVDNLPPAAWTPQIKRHRHNILEMPQSHFQGTFDIVNVSLTVTFVADSLIDTALTNVLAFLKPGGWLQWTEHDPMNSKIFAPTQTAKTEYMDQVVPGTWEFLGVPYPAWVPVIDSVFASHPGIAQGTVSCLKPEPDLALLRAWTELFFIAADELFAGSGKTEDEQKKVEKFSRIVEGAWREHVEEGAGYWTRLLRVVGRKHQ